jgi:aspartate/methionine/tyrosine aminotransferase
VGWVVEHSQAGLYLWASHPARDGWESVALLAEAGILVAPGTFYGPAGARHVRVALTATDERMAAAVARLAALP